MLQLNGQNVMKIASGALISVTIIYCGFICCPIFDRDARFVRKFALIFFRKIWISYRFFKKRGIPTPEYSYVLGNMPEIDQKVFTVSIVNRTNRFNYSIKELFRSAQRMDGEIRQNLRVWHSINDKIVHFRLNNSTWLLRFYEGHLPILVTSDLNIIQEVFFKQQANFMARKVFSYLLNWWFDSELEK